MLAHRQEHHELQHAEGDHQQGHPDYYQDDPRGFHLHEVESEAETHKHCGDVEHHPSEALPASDIHFQTTFVPQFLDALSSQTSWASNIHTATRVMFILSSCWAIFSKMGPVSRRLLATALMEYASRPCQTMNSTL